MSLSRATRSRAGHRICPVRGAPSASRGAASASPARRVTETLRRQLRCRNPQVLRTSAIAMTHPLEASGARRHQDAATMGPSRSGDYLGRDETGSIRLSRTVRTATTCARTCRSLARARGRSFSRGQPSGNACSRELARGGAIPPVAQQPAALVIPDLPEHRIPVPENADLGLPC